MAIYCRVSTADKNQTVENQLRDLLAVAARQDWEIVATFCDEGISGSKGRDKRPGFDNLLKGVARKDFDLIACFSVCRIGRSLPDLISFLGDIQAKGVDLYVHTQGLDTSTPSGAMMFQMLSVFSTYEKAILRERILSGLRRTTKKSGRKPMPDDRAQAIRKSLIDGQGIRATARLHRASTTTVTAIKRSMHDLNAASMMGVSAALHYDEGNDGSGR
ncbi:recombinase family protein [Brevundimonas sp.]|uniref:recombinase family protein n=1 Tax=Brevundimonas sp. TaxID=1871086 RepID=UPI0028AFFDD5|nr:recombinase family protein [Brevundimonas sp.]